MEQPYTPRKSKDELKSVRFVLKDVKKRVQQAKKNGDVDELEKCNEKIDVLIDHMKKVKLNGIGFEEQRKTYANMSKLSLEIGAVFGLMYVAQGKLLEKFMKKSIENRSIEYSAVYTCPPSKERDKLEEECDRRYDRDYKIASNWESMKDLTGIISMGGAVGAIETGIESTGGARLQMKMNKQIKILEKMSRELKAEIQQLKSQQRGIKESVNDVRLEIYESCYYGDITEDERDLLLDMIEE
jgi:hypothetical protein